MITPRRIQQLVRNGCMPRAERGRYTIVEAVQGYLRFLQDEERRASRSGSAIDARIKDMRAREIDLTWDFGMGG